MPASSAAALPRPPVVRRRDACRFRSLTLAALLVGAARLAGAGAPAVPADPGGGTFVAPDPRDLVIYHVMIDRFDNGDPTNDAANPRTTPSPAQPWGWHGGDFEGVRRRLPYIRGLGANGLWLSPLLENVNSYHGYGTFDWYRIEPNLGTLEELHRLIAEANALGIAVYFDLVAGHCSKIIDSVEPGWPAYRTPPDRYALRWSSDLRYPAPFDSLDYFHAHGAIPRWTSPEQELGELSGLDDLATETPYVREQMTAIWLHWLRATGVSGFRVDTVKHVDRGFWEVFLPALAAEARALGRENYYTFGEVYGADDDLMAHYVGELDGAPYKFDAALDFQYYFTGLDVFARAEAPPAALAGRLERRAARLGPVHHLLTPNFIDNHDVQRFLFVASGAGAPPEVRRRRLELALVTLFAAPGPPVVYYGTEQGFDGGNDPHNREDMFDGAFEQGPSEGDNFDATSPLYRLVARLGAARAASLALRRGTAEIAVAAEDGPGVLVLVRRGGGDAAVLRLNTASEPREVAALAVAEWAGAGVVDVAAGEGAAARVLDAAGVLPAATLPPLAAELWVRAEGAAPVAATAAP